MEIIELRKDKEYLTLGQLLKIENYVSSGGETKLFLENETIYVNDELENRRGRKLYPNDIIKIYDKTYQIK